MDPMINNGALDVDPHVEVLVFHPEWIRPSEEQVRVALEDLGWLAPGGLVADTGYGDEVETIFLAHLNDATLLAALTGEVDGTAGDLHLTVLVG